jgi:hypothetical protein
MAKVGEGRSLGVLWDVESQDVGTDGTNAIAIAVGKFILLKILDICQSHVEGESVRGGELSCEGPVPVVPTQRLPGRIPNQRLPK